MIDWADVCDLEFNGIETADYPDFADARVASATHRIEQRPLTDEELDYINDQYSTEVYEAVLERVF